MGTRGLVGIRYKGRTYYFYNHWDSNPKALGVALVKELLSLDFEGFLAILDGLFVVVGDEHVEEAIRRLDESGICFETGFVDTRSAGEPPFVLQTLLTGFHDFYPGLANAPQDLLARIKHLTLGDVARKRKVTTRDDLEALVEYGGIVGWSTQCEPPFGPLARYTRLGVCVPLFIVEGEDQEDHRDLFIEWVYRVDFDTKTLKVSGMEILPFSMITSVEAFKDYIKHHSTDDE